ncbi:non-ribosomal peptide synthetase [Massilia pseudoviolaceinigra]|uniref:non-ribosomal peptide synthetase n=1 Tax=Massilia pseudoviolaceinigra TaxID=3057165 RepID=UPI0027963DDE|nr:non-ribosomal peptide synthetase [Massilia sp. CCM 9206]MDQ1924826.1 amino acid adenylation domain-containing protein [Massilia sp. CCM 9206]
MNSPYFSAPADGVLEGFALSPQQASQWRWQQAYGTTAVPLASLRLRIDAPVDLPRLRASLAQVVARHEILRTAYQQLPGMALPMQIIAPSGEMPWLDPDDQGPGVEMTPGADGTLRLCLRLPAFQADSASMMALARDWLDVYQGGPLADVALQYADYAAWRGELLESQNDPHPLWEPFRNQALSAQALPLRPGAAVTVIEHHTVACALDAAVEQRWKDYARESGQAPELVLLAAWIALCHQHSGAERLTIGFDAQQRSGATAGALGLYGEALPLAAGRLDAVDFAGLCGELERQCALLAEWRDSYPADLFDQPFALGFRWIAPACPALAQAGWHVERVCAPAAPFQLLLETSDSGLCWHVNRALYDAAAVALLSDQLATLLDSACRQPGRLLRELSACSPREQQLLTRELSGSLPLSVDQQQRYDAVKALGSLAQCFSGQVCAHADMPAVEGASGQLSYRELDERSTLLARHLLARGLAPQSRVVHLLPRDIDAVVAMLAIFKAGACYVPVDPGYPAQRVQFILDDCQARLIITHSSLLATLAPHLQERALVIDTMPAPTPSDQPLPSGARQDCAYLIYTSGSTGQPKGVQITHANALHSLAARVAYYPDPVRKFLLLSSFAFDSSIAGLFWSLAQGGTLVICSQDDQKDPARLAHIIRASAVTHMLALPSMYAMLLEQPGTPPAALSTAIVAGETCPPELVQAHHQAWPHARLYNEYGPTEASVWCSVAELKAQVSIGRAIAHTRVYLLDADGAPAARGMLGEIHIAGPGLSPGYADRPELSAEKFITASHPLLAGERLYRSGDIGYLDQDGTLMFAGRADAQVKVRGYRIELGEIEAALRDASGASLAMALAETRDGATLLRGFIETRDKTDLAALRAALALRLPEYMIPADIQVLASLPRNANGKVDAKALLALRASHQRAPYAAPATPAECQLARLWHQLLDCEAPGADDDFFSLGGHSLLVVRLVHLIKSTLGSDIPVGAVFRNPTIRSLAAQLAPSSAASSLLPLRSGDGHHPPVFFLHRPAGDVQHYAPLIASLPEGQAAYGIVLPHGVGPEQASLAQLAQRYLGQVKSVQPQGPYFLCGWSMGGLLALEMASLIEQGGDCVGMLAIVDSSFNPGDEGLSGDELLQLVLQELTEESCRRLASAHGARTALSTLDAGMGKMAQLRRAFDEWCPAHNMVLKSSPAIVAATLDAMEHARQWVASCTPPTVSAELHLWWAEATLAGQPDLPMHWARHSVTAAHHVHVPGDHDDILHHPAFSATFNAALRASRRDLAT